MRGRPGTWIAFAVVAGLAGVVEVGWFSIPLGALLIFVAVGAAIVGIGRTHSEPGYHETHLPNPR
jgi:hypothetical protein